MRPEDVKPLFERVGAFRNGHFVYASKRHGRDYVNKDAAFTKVKEMRRLTLALALRFKGANAEVVIGPAIGGALIAQQVAGHLCDWTGREVDSVFAEKDGSGGFVIKRGYGALIKGRRVLVTEDVLTTGASARKTVDAVKAAGGEVVGVGAFVNRDGVTAESLGVPRLETLLFHSLAAYAAEDCPLCREGVPVNADLGHGAAYIAERQAAIIAAEEAKDAAREVGQGDGGAEEPRVIEMATVSAETLPAGEGARVVTLDTACGPRMQVEPKDRIIYALDADSHERASPLARMIAPHVGGIKVGLEALSSIGLPQAVSMVSNAGAAVMVDGKFHDIPNTMRAAVAALVKRRVGMFTVHASAGRAGMAAAAEAKGNALALAVTVLTSMDDADCVSTYHSDVRTKVLRFAQDAKESGMDGIVCSAADLVHLGPFARANRMILATPGIRPASAAQGDQKRIVTPTDAIRLGAHFLIIGRPITEAREEDGGPAEAVRRIADEIRVALALKGR
ncbi:MAG: Orotidine 5-phosphate decarboxylase [Candidatus Parcubacteria bacterium]|jgi:orotate phosphoribosyltransferase